MTDLDGLELLRFLWVDNANVIRAKSVPLLGAEVDRVDLDRAVRISQAQLAIPVHAFRESTVFSGAMGGFTRPTARCTAPLRTRWPDWTSTG